MSQSIDIPAIKDGEAGGDQPQSRLRLLRDICRDVVFVLFCITILPFYLLYTAIVRPTSYEFSGIETVLVVLLCIAFFPIFLAYMAITWVFCLDYATRVQASQFFSNKESKYYKKVHQSLQTEMRFEWLSKIISRQLVILPLAWLIFTLSVPGLQKKELLGAELWKWSLLVAMVLCGYSIISLTTRFFLFLLFKNKKLKGNETAEYYARGLRRNVNLVVHTGAILLTWIFYFRTSRGLIKKPEGGNEGLLDAHVWIWSFITLVTAASLWLLKKFLLLKWEAEAVYMRFRERILNSGFQLYFVSHICDLHLHKLQPKSSCRTEDHSPTAMDDFQYHNSTTDEHGSTNEEMKKREENAKKAQSKETTSTENTDRERDENGNKLAQSKDDMDKGREENGKKLGQSKETQLAEEETDNEREENKKKAKEILDIDHDKEGTTYRIKQKTRYFVALSKCEVSSKEDGTSDVLEHCNKIKPTGVDHRYITQEDLRVFDLEDEDARILYDRLRKEQPQEQPQGPGLDNINAVTYEHFEKWMVKAHKNCIALGRTLSDARGVVNVLDKVLTTILIAIAILAWLLLTDIASTKILVLIASPLLATVFVFGDTCKKIFEGIIFSFISHPFDVGDRCIIAEKELEVKRMSVLATTFIVIGTKEEALYPNSTLATMPIINLKGEPDPNDIVELTLDSIIYTKPMLDELQGKISGFFNQNKGQYMEHVLIIKEIRESSTKMEIQFQHVMSIDETTHSQCLRKKRKQKSELLLQIKQFTEEVNKGTPKNEDITPNA